MILKQNAFESDVLKLSYVDIIALTDGKKLQVSGLTVEYIEDNNNSLGKALAKGLSERGKVKDEL